MEINIGSFNTLDVTNSVQDTWSKFDIMRCHS